jgi:hypothetical protein
MSRGVLAAGLWLAAAGPAFAHRLDLEVTVEDGRLRLVAAYETDEPAAEARVRVIAADGRVVLDGQTDERGVWSAPQPSAGTYTVEVRSVGHRQTATVVVGAAAPVEVSTTPTGPPWLGIGLGLAVIAAVAVALRFVTRRRG